jgi:lysophospholipase L1-like esterase
MKTLHVVGDSISQQYGPHLAQYLAGFFAYSRKEGMPGDPTEPNGANGGDSSLVLRYLQAWQKRQGRWDCLLINCGLHDLRTTPATQAKQVAIDHYERNLREIMPVACTLAPRVIWARTTPVVDAIHNKPNMEFHRFAADVDRYNAVADAIMKASRIPVIDLFGFTRNLGDDLFIDHVHFRENIQQLQAAFIAGSLMAL